MNYAICKLLPWVKEFLEESLEELSLNELCLNEICLEGLLYNPNIAGASALFESFHEAFKQNRIKEVCDKAIEYSLSHTLELYEGGLAGFLERGYPNIEESSEMVFDENERILNFTPTPINWKFCYSNPNIGIYLRGNAEEIFWLEKSSDPYAIDLLKKNQDRINLHAFLMNPGIFVLDYEKMKQIRRPIAQELAELFAKIETNPSKIEEYLENEGDLEDEEI
jgi:hypothetical protein